MKLDLFHRLTLIESAWAWQGSCWQKGTVISHSSAVGSYLLQVYFEGKMGWGWGLCSNRYYLIIYIAYAPVEERCGQSHNICIF